MNTDGITVRPAAEDDHPALVAAVDEWWGGRRMAPLLPRLFFQHFRDTGLVAERDGRPVGFVIGFVSQVDPAVAYIHFVGVDPAERGRGLAAELYGRFFQLAAGRGCVEVRCITSPVNTGSVAFHRAMGFEVLPGDSVSEEGTVFSADYDGPGEGRVCFRRQLAV